MKDEALVNNTYLLEKYPGKGGWTYAMIPEVLQDKKAPFGWVQVKGSIDDYEFNNLRLMPMGNGKLFFPVKAEIRKKIGKREGDTVHIILFKDNDPPILPPELALCFKEETMSFEIFSSYSQSEQKRFIDWINASKNDHEKIDRVSVVLEKLRNNRKFSDK